MSLQQNDTYHQSINEYAEEYQAELNEDLELKHYHRQLRKVWLDLLDRYPQHYSPLDYFAACQKSKLLIF